MYTGSVAFEQRELIFALLPSVHFMKLEDEIGQKKFRSEYHKAAINLIYTANWIQSFLGDALKPYDLTVQQFNLLRILRGQHPSPASIKLLRERMLDKMSDASRLVEKLRQKGMVNREVSEVDRRNVDVVITEKGLETLSALDKYDNIYQERFSNLIEEEIVQLNSLLDKMRKDL